NHEAYRGARGEREQRLRRIKRRREDGEHDQQNPERPRHGQFAEIFPHSPAPFWPSAAAITVGASDFPGNVEVIVPERMTPMRSLMPRISGRSLEIIRTARPLF